MKKKRKKEESETKIWHNSGIWVKRRKYSGESFIFSQIFSKSLIEFNFCFYLRKYQQLNIHQSKKYLLQNKISALEYIHRLHIIARLHKTKDKTIYILLHWSYNVHALDSYELSGWKLSKIFVNLDQTFGKTKNDDAVWWLFYCFVFPEKSKV